MFTKFFAATLAGTLVLAAGFGRDVRPAAEALFEGCSSVIRTGAESLAPRLGNQIAANKHKAMINEVNSTITKSSAMISDVDHQSPGAKSRLSDALVQRQLATETLARCDAAISSAGPCDISLLEGQPRTIDEIKVSRQKAAEQLQNAEVTIRKLGPVVKERQRLFDGLKSMLVRKDELEREFLKVSEARLLAQSAAYLAELQNQFVDPESLQSRQLIVDEAREQLTRQADAPDKMSVAGN